MRPIPTQPPPPEVPPTQAAFEQPVPGQDLATVEQLLQHFEELEVQLAQVRDGLTHSHRLATLGTIASIIAHEYNNILTPIVSYAQLALAKPDDRDLMKKAVEKALSGAERAAHISASLLGFARDSDEQRAAPLRKTIDETIACLGRDPRKDGVELAIDVPDVQVAMRPLHLQQVLLNLILNAKKAMHRRGGRLSVTGTLEADMVNLEVADTGPGIPEQILDRLFEPFVTYRHANPAIVAPAPSGRDQPARTAEPRGTGLGLCICRDLVRNAGGTISVTSVTGKGATFHIRIPRAEDLFEST